MYPYIFHKAIFAYHKAMTVSVETLLLEGISALVFEQEVPHPKRREQLTRFRQCEGNPQDPTLFVIYHC